MKPTSVATTAAKISSDRAVRSDRALPTAPIAGVTRSVRIPPRSDRYIASPQGVPVCRAGDAPSPAVSEDDSSPVLIERRPSECGCAVTYCQHVGRAPRWKRVGRACLRIQGRTRPDHAWSCRDRSDTRAPSLWTKGDIVVRAVTWARTESRPRTLEGGWPSHGIGSQNL